MDDSKNKMYLAHSGVVDRKKMLLYSLFLPALLGVLLLGVGLAGIYVAHKSTLAMRELKKSSLEVTFDLQEIASNLQELRIQVTKPIQTSGHEGIVKLLKKIESAKESILFKTKNQTYSPYIVIWAKNWGESKKRFEHDLMEPDQSELSLIDLDPKIAILIDQISSVITFFQSDAGDQVGENEIFSRRASSLLVMSLVLGMLLGIAFGVIIARGLNQLYLTIEHGREDLRSRFEQYVNLLRIISHDVATPLGVAIMATDNLPNLPLNQKAKNRIEGALSQINQILSELRSLQAMIDGKRKPNLLSLSLEKVVNEALDGFKEKFEAKSIRVQVDIPGFNVLADPFFLRFQVLGNLISNAIKFSYKGNILLIKAIPIENTICLIFKDQGAGIPPELLPKLFLVDGDTSRPGTQGEKGTGFGMPLMKTALDTMGAKIEVNSRFYVNYPNDHGTEFRIFLQAPDESQIKNRHAELAS